PQVPQPLGRRRPSLPIYLPRFYAGGGLQVFAEKRYRFSRRAGQTADGLIGALRIVAGEIGPAGVEFGRAERLARSVQPAGQVPDEGRRILGARDQTLTVR